MVRRTRDSGTIWPSSVQSDASGIGIISFAGSYHSKNRPRSQKSERWAHLSELIDQGVEVRFAGEDLDIKTRCGRLPAGIQAVVAANFVRNLREETKKGFYGRLKQGLSPLPAPLGCVNNGGGKVKTNDLAAGPMLRELFMTCLENNSNLAGLY